MDDKKAQNRIDSFEERFKKMSEELAEQRRERQGRNSSGPAELPTEGSGGAIAVYKSRKALVKYQPRERSEGAFRRTVRLVKGLKEAKAKADALPGCSAENRRDLYREVFCDAWAPVVNAFDNASDTLWGFLTSLGYDIAEIVIFIVNLVIKISYYAGSAAIFVWDKIWDVRLWLDMHKKGVFQIFASVVTVVAMGLIMISSMSAYEYSYYGRKLGVTKSREDVYKVIETLGDKLSESSGANISLDVERDIVFERVYGFGMDIDTPDDILNTLTYMKDIRVEAYAVCINGEQAVVVDNENTANNIIQRVKDYFSQPTPGYEYTSVTYAEELEVVPVNVKIAELWNPATAVRYIETGSTRVLKDGETPHPKVTVLSSATFSVDEEIPFGTRYIKNNSMYITEVSPISEGQTGLTRTTYLVQLENNVEVSKVEQSSVIVRNPVDEVYYQGTKPLPDSIGTGTWLFPLRGSYTPTSPFGWRNTGIAGATRQHAGADLYQPPGSKIYAADGGVVVAAGWNSGYGWYVQIDHGSLYQTVYAHCSKLLVKVGDRVAQGQNIALVGSSGVASGPHLHFEVQFNGTPINPNLIFPNIYKGYW